MRSPKHCCYGSATIPSLFIVDSVNIAVKNLKVFVVAMDMQKWVRFGVFSSLQYIVLLL